MEDKDVDKLLKGVKDDINTLIANVIKTGSIRFTDFCTEWKRMNFSLIFSEREKLYELLEFSEEIIHLAKGYLAPPWKLATRITALYILYGLFFKQPIKKAAKIRLTKDEWQDLDQLIQECKEAKYYDVVLIHLKLYLHGGYSFTAISRATGLERGFRKYEDKCKKDKSAFEEIFSSKEFSLDTELLDSFISMECQYSNKKNEVLGKRNLDFADKDFGVTLKKKIEEFYDKNRKQHSSCKTNEKTEVNEISQCLNHGNPDKTANQQGESEDIGVVRSMIKAKALLFSANKDNMLPIIDSYEKSIPEEINENEISNDSEESIDLASLKSRILAKTASPVDQSYENSASERTLNIPEKMYEEDSSAYSEDIDLRDDSYSNNYSLPIL